MSDDDVVRAWKDRRYRRGLSASQRKRMPDHPAGLVEVPDDQLGQVAGGATNYYLSMGCCNYLTEGTGPCGSCDCTVLHSNCNSCFAL